MNFSKNQFNYGEIVDFILPDSKIALETNHLDDNGDLNTRDQIQDFKFVRGLF